MEDNWIQVAVIFIVAALWLVCGYVIGSNA